MQFPKEFEKLLHEALPEIESAALLDSLEWPSYSSLRLNSKNNIALKPALKGDPVKHAENAFLLKERPSFVSDPAFHSGQYYVQESSSMIIGTVIKELLQKSETGSVVLDLCAAPGGKSTHIASVLGPEDILVANEVIHSRTPVLHENLCKWGAGNHLITRSDSREFGKCEGVFDIIVADMPCSGEGLFRKDPDAIKEWSENNVGICCERQKRIGADIWNALAEGGYFIYSTCTYNSKENEENVQWIMQELGAEIVPFSFPEDWMFYENIPGMYRLMPHRTVGEGFFFCVLKKSGKTHKKDPKRWMKVNFSPQFDLYFNEKVRVFEWQDEWYFNRNPRPELIRYLLSVLPMLYAPGSPLGRNFDKGFKPDVSLVLSGVFNQDSLPKVTFNDAEIIRYYRRESLPNLHKEQGIHVVYWNGIPCGLANGVKHQWNNQWPMEWRIRKEGIVAETILDF